MIKNLLTVVVMLFCILAMQEIFAQSEQFKFKHLTLDNGLSHPEIRAIYKDSRGFLWFGSASGLNRFDGYTIKSFYNDARDTTSLPDNVIANIFETPDGLLGVVTSAGLTLFHYDKENFQRDLSNFHAKYSTSNRLKNIQRDRDGAFWFTETSKLIRYLPKENKSTVIKNVAGDSTSIVKDSITDFTVGTNGDYWLAHSSGVIEKLVFRNGRARVLQRVFGSNYFTRNDHNEYRILCDSDGDVWIYVPGLNEGVVHYESRTGLLQSVSTKSSGYTLSKNSVSRLIEGNDGKIWVGTDHGGVTIIDKHHRTVQYVMHQDGNEKKFSGKLHRLFV